MKKKSNPPSPEKYAMSGTEDAEQIALFMWAALKENQEKYPDLKYMFAIPNGMYTPNKSVSARMRAMGMKRGVPDIMLPVRRDAWPGLFIELKRQHTDKQKAGKVTDNQDDYIAFLRSQGYGTVVCYGYEHAKTVIIEYLSYKPKMTVKDKETFEIEE